MIGRNDMKKNVIAAVLAAVSYTHLDVYKRQGQYHGEGQYSRSVHGNSQDFAPAQKCRPVLLHPENAPGCGGRKYGQIPDG